MLRIRAPQFQRLAALAESVDDGEPVYCHRDLKAVNTLLEEDGRRWLLDWDNCGPQEPWCELGALLLHHACDDAADPAHRAFAADHVAALAAGIPSVSALEAAAVAARGR